MSILNVEHLTHGFGDRAIFTDVSFRLLKGEHIGLVGANGEGKSTFMNIVTGKLMPDEGKVDEEEMNLLMEELGTIQDELTLHDFYTIDAKVEEVARALGLLDLGWTGM